MKARLEAALARADEVERELANPATAKDPRKLKSLGREHVRLDRIRKTSDRVGKLRDELEQAHELADDDDAGMVELARADIERLEPVVAGLAEELDGLLVPPDPLDDRDIIVEIRAGTGGDEAGLFAGDLFRMYTNSRQ